MAPNQPKYRILIVGDISNNRKLLKNILESLGFDIHEAGNGKESVDIWRKWQPHLIWMDIRMPVMDGYEATIKIREEEQESRSSEIEKCEIPIRVAPTVIIALSAGVFEQQRVEALKIGCDDFVCKPLAEQEIFEKMQKHLGIRYAYEGEQLVASSRPEPGWKEGLTAEALAALPSNLQLTLKKGARRADFILLSRIIEQISRNDATLAKALAQLVDNFEYDKILALISQPD